jgi:hypothetical protein
VRSRDVGERFLNRKRLVAVATSVAVGFALWWPLQEIVNEEEAWDSAAYQPVVSVVAALLGFAFGRGERLRFGFLLGIALAASQVFAVAVFSEDDEGANFVGVAIVFGIPFFGLAFGAIALVGIFLRNVIAEKMA